MCDGFLRDVGFVLGKKRRRSFNKIVLGRLFWDEMNRRFVGMDSDTFC
jgi:hypothetical protein